MNRRTFIASGIGASLPLSVAPSAAFSQGGIPSPHHVKLELKPLLTNSVHTGVWEGPCRFNVVPVEEEKARVHGNYAAWKEELRALGALLGISVDVVT